MNKIKSIYHFRITFCFIKKNTKNNNKETGKKKKKYCKITDKDMT